jgi:uncharacterized protein YggE
MTICEVAEADKPRRSVSITASGWVTAPPDIARIGLGIVTETDDARTALDGNSAIMARIIDGLKRAGIPAKDLRTMSLSIMPRYRDTDDGSRETMNGYWASSQVRAAVRDIGRVGEILDLAVSLGANRIDHVSFDVTEAELLKDEARVQAMATARQRGELLAKAAGARLGPVLSIAEHAYNGGGYAAAFYDVGSGTRRMVPPVEAGAQQIGVQVNVVYGLS